MCLLIAGTEFTSKAFLQLLKQRGHHHGVLQSSLSKAFLAERQIATFRSRLTVLRLPLSLQAYIKGNGWAQFVTTIVHTMNHTKSRVLAKGQVTPYQLVSRNAHANDLILEQEKAKYDQVASDAVDFVQQKEKTIEEAALLRGQYCNVVLLKKTPFEKGSMRTKVSREVFKITHTKEAVGKKPYVGLADMLNEPIRGLFLSSECRLIPRYLLLLYPVGEQ